MKILDLHQGSDEWKAARAKYFTASEAPAMLGLSKYQTRNDLLNQKATGISADIDDNKQRLFDRGHEAEAFARPIVESLIGDELYPTTGTREVDGLPLLASFDGLTMDGTTTWENKLWNADLERDIEVGEIADHYWPQLEQQLIVSGADRAYFTASDGTPEKTIGLWYQSVPARRQRLIAGWKQFAEDLASYVPVEVIPAAVATPQMALPAVAIQVEGAIALRDNLDAFGNALRDYVGGLNRKPQTDQDFADLDASAKLLREVQVKIAAARDGALGQIESIDVMKRTADVLEELARATAVEVEKLVKAEKENRRNAILQKAKDELQARIAKHNERFGKSYMPPVAADFAGKAKGLKSLSSIQNAVDTELALVTIEANDLANNIDANLTTLRELAGDHKFLFSDTPTIILKKPDDLMALVKSRIAEHKAEQDRKLEAEREKIRKEEQERADREAAAKVEAERKASESIKPVGVEQTQTAQAVQPVPMQASPTLGQVLHAVAPAVIAQSTPQDTAWKIAGLVANMQEIDRVRVLQFCERVIEQRQQAAA